MTTSGAPAIGISSTLASVGGRALDVVRRVVVDAEEIERRADQLHVAVADQRRRRQQVRARLRRIAPVQDRVEEDPVLFGVQRPSRPPRSLSRRPGSALHVERDPDCAAGSSAAEAREREAVAEQQVVGRRGGEGVVGMTRRVHADAVALVRDDLGLVDRDPDRTRRHRSPRRRSGRSRRSAPPCRGWPSRRRPRAPAADPSGRG